MKSLVVFKDDGPDSAHWFAPLMREGFKHCFVVLENNGYMTLIDAKAGVPNVEVVCGSDYDLAGFYEDAGYTVIEAEQGDKPPRAPFAVANCVGLVKAILCIRSYAITPLQLYRHLKRKRDAIPRQVNHQHAEAIAGGTDPAPRGADADSRYSGGGRRIDAGRRKKAVSAASG